MLPVDEIRLNFNPASIAALNAVLAFLMFGIALDTRVEDFKRVLRMPVAMAVGVAAQFIVLPAVTFGLTLILKPAPSIALGMILVACCPPGNVSNILTHRARGNVALSVSMTALSNFLSILVMPLNFAFWGGLHPTAAPLLKAIALDSSEIVLHIVIIIGVPFVLGLACSHWLPRLTARTKKPARILSFICLVGLILAAIAGNWRYFLDYVGLVLLAVVLHDALAFATGYACATACGLGEYDRRAVSFEVGVRNAGLGLVLIFGFFGGLGGMAVVAGVWGFWDIVAGLVLAAWWARRPLPLLFRRPLDRPELVFMDVSLPFAARRVLVTGADGFLGRTVVAALAQLPDIDRVVALDVREVPAVRRVAGVTYAVQDVRSTGLGATLSAHAIDSVVHLASIVTPGPGSTREFEYSVDVLGTRNVLEACVANGVRHIVVSSSGAAYGYHADNPAWIDETQPLRGNETFAYAHHKRLVEEMLAAYRVSHPRLQQTVLRIGTILGAHVHNQITALFDKPRILAISGSDSPFVFIWDEDVTGCVVHAITTGRTGSFNVAGDGALTLAQIAALLKKPLLTLPAPLLRLALSVGSRLHLTRYGPEQLDFLRYRPVLCNDRLKADFGYVPRKTSLEAFMAFKAARCSRHSQPGALVP